MTDFLGFASRGKNAWWRYGLSLVLGFVLACIGLFVLTLMLTFLHLLPPGIATELQKPQHPQVFFPGIAVVFAGMTAGFMAAIAMVQNKRPGDVIGCWRWPLYFRGVGIWTAVQCALALIDVPIAPHGFSITATSGTAALAVSALFGLAVQTFSEEFLFRGYVTQGVLLALKKPLPAAIVSGLLFGAMHIPNGLVQAINAVIFGIVCSLIAIRTGGIAMTCGIHLANNYFGAVVLVSTGDVFRGSPGLVTQNTPQLMWWDLCVGVLTLAGLAWWVLRRPLSPSSARL
jgi:uncharacterized protein